MNKHIEAIKRVIAKRSERGASVESLNKVKQRLLITWKNSPAMVNAINNIKFEGVKAI